MLVPAGIASIRMLVASGDQEGFTAAMRSLLDDAPARWRMSQAARMHAEEWFSVDRMVRGYSDLYQAALGKVRP